MHYYPDLIVMISKLFGLGWAGLRCAGLGWAVLHPVCIRIVLGSIGSVGFGYKTKWSFVHVY